MALLVLAFALGSPALAAVPGYTCPWKSVESVSTTLTGLTVNGETYDVRGRKVHGTGDYEVNVSKGAFGNYNVSAREKTRYGEHYYEDVATMLQICGEEKAADELRRWRASRRSFNWSFVLVPYGLPWTVAAGLAARHHRDALEAALTTPDKEKKATLASDGVAYLFP